MSALILMMLKDDTEALEEEIADIFKLLNLPEYRHFAVCPQNRARLKALLRDLLIKLAEQKQKRLKRYMKKWGRKKNISRAKMKKMIDFILSAEFMTFYIVEGCLDFVLQSSIEKYPRAGVIYSTQGILFARKINYSPHENFTVKGISY